MTRKIIAVLGVTGAVGEALLNILHERKFPIGQLFPLASNRLAGQPIEFGNKSLLIKTLQILILLKLKLRYLARVPKCQHSTHLLLQKRDV